MTTVFLTIVFVEKILLFKGNDSGGTDVYQSHKRVPCDG